MDGHLLENIPLFAKLPHEQLDELAGVLRQRRYRHGETVFRAGDEGTEFYVIQVGAVHFAFNDARGHEVSLGELGTGEFFGEVALLDGGPRTETATARGDTALLAMSRHDFMDFLERRPTSTAYIVSVLGARLREAMYRLQQA